MERRYPARALVTRRSGLQGGFRRIGTVVLAIGVLAALAGCGDDGPDEPPEDVAVAIIEASESGDGIATCEYLSQANLEALPGSDGTIASCRDAVGAAHGDTEPSRTVSTEVDGVAVEDDVATVTVSGRYSGGGEPGEVASAGVFSSVVTLIVEDGEWKVASVKRP